MASKQMELQSMIRVSMKSDTPFKNLCTNLAHIKCTTTYQVKTKKKYVGDLWEEFCCLYLLNVRNFQSAILLKDMTEHDLEALNLKRRDVGIDIIGHDQNGNAIAIQCKFRSRGNVSWRDISTFEALCARSGPWKQHLVMTNASKVIREGNDTEKDSVVVKVHFEKLKKHEWNILSGYGFGNTCGGSLSMDEIKDLWLKRIDDTTDH